MQEYIDFVSNNMLLTLAWVGLAAALLMSLIKQKTAAYKVVAPNQAAIITNRENGVFVDIRSRDEYRAGHITGAINLLPSEIKSNSLGELEKHKNAPIIVVCKTGQTAAESANQLVKAGFDTVYVLKDGLTSWNDANMPLVRAKSSKGKTKKKK
ncbi:MULTISPECIES: rhodanese-like domain-containing protein [unclassified Salinivibrio]|uniref:rhodanese-like domain-containing protein n=1 Tax=unclassified Salinivibrio TaxID=2636825 RepID=UPI00084C2900|nr:MULTISPECIES: rhodanese-like domain-containing protein [unclassified Salinivibrio]ODP96760.1 rhodanese-like domain-containing protein [Salinivibrio sp. DV]OOF23474.1 rhodanese-like domain-containing protein [Salinivibrio sp. IB574]